MHARSAFLPLAFALSLSVSPTKATADQLVTVEGTLSHDRDAVWQVQLAPDRKIDVDGKAVEVVRFVAYGASDETWCAQFNGKKVEVTGEIDSGDTAQLKGSVAFMVLYTMTAGQPEPVPLSQLIRAEMNHDSDANKHPPGQPLYRFAYYLVLLDRPDGCEKCYVPLLLSPRPLENMSTGRDSQDDETVVSITTYERDSIWEANGLALITSAAMNRSLHTIKFRGRNYRYEPANADGVVHLLEHPMGTIAISRIRLPNSEAPGANLADLIAGFHTVFRVRERDTTFPPAIHLSAVKRPSDSNAKNEENGPVMSELTVFDDGKVEYRSALACMNRRALIEPRKPHMAALTVSALSWNWRETCPDRQSAEATSTYTLEPADFARLKQLINQKEVNDLYGCFCNATLGVGDFDIEVPRPDSTQHVSAVGFMPEHIDLRERPALTYLICKAKEISQQATKESVPAWCSNLPPLK